MKRKYVILVFISAVFIFLDQYTKMLATKFLKGKDPIVVIESFFDLRYVTNRGAAWGMFGQLSDNIRIPFFILITIIAAIIIFYYYHNLKRKQLLLQFSLSFIFAGMIGNFIDRVFVRFVVDFVDWHINNHHWPAFNVADICISVGMGLIVIDWIIHHKEYAEAERLKKEAKEQKTMKE